MNLAAMRASVLTLVSPPAGLKKETLDRAIALLKSGGAGSVDEPVWLEQGRAADIFFDENNPDFFAQLRKKLPDLPGTDCFVQPAATRRKKLLMADMDATMVVGETLDEMAAHFNLKDKIAPITARAMRGEIDFAEALRLRVGMLKGMPVEAIEEVIAAVRPSPGATTLVRTMGRFGARCVLISGGFDIFTGRVAATLGFHKDYANRLGMQDGRLTGEVIPPIVDKNFKKEKTGEEARKLGLGMEQVMAVGDGANDIPMLQTAGAGVGYFAKPAVQEATPYQVRYTDLTALLFMQGYRKEEFA